MANLEDVKNNENDIKEAVENTQAKPVRYINLRTHTAYSLAEGAIKIKDLVSHCKDNEIPAVAITDTNNLFGGADFSYNLVGAGVQPILGTQLAVNFKTEIDGDRLRKESSYATSWLPEGVVFKSDAAGVANFLSQIILLVQNETGYRNLLKIISDAHLLSPDNEPAHTLLKYIKDRSEGLICLTGGVRGIVGQAILMEEEEIAEQKLLELKEVFGDRLYLEMSRLGTNEEEKCEDKFIELAYKHNIPLVATNETFFLTKDMYVAHDALICVTASRFVEEEDRRHETMENYLKSEEEMAELFEDLPEALESTVNIARRCGYGVKKSPPLLPHVEKGITDEDEKKMLYDNCMVGIKKRFEERNIPEDKWQKYYDMIDFEVGVINNMGFPGYFLIVEDFMRWCAENGVPTGPGRGSGAGSCVAWALRITELDPDRFGLLFERFLNPDRVNMPDFDIDFCQDNRHRVIEYVQQKYGYDSVSQIITFGQFKAKLVIRDIARVLKFPYSRADMLSKMIPDKSLANPMTIAEALDASDEFRAEYEDHEEIKFLIDICLKLEGLYRHASTHAAGVLIGDRPIEQLSPLYKDPKSDMPVSQYNMKYIEDTGLVKYDFLGLKTLSIIKQAIDLVKRNHDVDIDFSRMEFEDKRTYELFSAAQTVGVFQLESRGMQKYLGELKPSNIEDIIAMCALYRPGPMDNIPSFINRKHGLEEVTYPHPLLEEILKPTYGIIVYQEQVMQISRVLAGYTRGESDSLRKAMGKKIAKLMAEHKVKFRDGCLANNVDEEVITKLWDDMEKFAAYAFNKAHSACYGIIAYQTAYLKANYPIEFMTATFNYDLGNQDKIKLFYEDTKKMGYDILPPDINKSEGKFTTEDGKVRFGLTALKNVGEGFVADIVEERKNNGEFKTLNDFIQRVARRKTGSINKKMLDGLIKAGALDKLEPNRAKLFEGIPNILSYAHGLSKDAEINQSSLFFNDTEDENTAVFDFKFPDCADWMPSEKLNYENEIIGFNITPNPLKIYEKHIKSFAYDRIKDIPKLKKGRIVKVVGIIEEFYKRTSRNGKDYIALKLGDDLESMDFLFFNELDFIKKQADSVGKAPVVVEGDFKINSSGTICFGKRISLLRDSLGDSVNEIEIEITSEEAVKQLRDTLAKAGRGHNSVILVSNAGGKRVTMKLPEKYNINEEFREMINNLNGCKIVV
ncbi:MAG: DNA polymerase III subunit alpha [Alphaproteobacteria bacterium]|jgi:DNA polymerase-3 subunit alpha|nr:DNA polymerase III subunit alpha [Alphaproteobacteria bacterium]